MLLNKKDRATTLGLILLAERYASFLDKLAAKLPEDKKKERADAEKEATFARALIIRARPMRVKLEKQIKILIPSEATAAGGKDEKKEEEAPNDKG